MSAAPLCIATAVQPHVVAHGASPGDVSARENGPFVCSVALPSPFGGHGAAHAPAIPAGRRPPPAASPAAAARPGCRRTPGRLHLIWLPGRLPSPHTTAAVACRSARPAGPGRATAASVRRRHLGVRRCNLPPASACPVHTAAALTLLSVPGAWTWRTTCSTLTLQTRRPGLRLLYVTPFVVPFTARLRRQTRS